MAGGLNGECGEPGRARWPRGVEGTGCAAAPLLNLLYFRICDIGNAVVIRELSKFIITTLLHYPTRCGYETEIFYPVALFTFCQFAFPFCEWTENGGANSVEECYEVFSQLQHW